MPTRVPTYKVFGLALQNTIRFQFTRNGRCFISIENNDLQLCIGWRNLKGEI